MAKFTMHGRKVWVHRVVMASFVIMMILGTTFVGYAMYSGIRIMSANMERMTVQQEAKTHAVTAVKGINNVSANSTETTETGLLQNGLNQDELAMIKLVNQERAARGLNELQIDLQLVDTARVKAQDLIDKHYFEHQSPDLGSPFDMFKRAGMQYIYAGENLAGAANVENAHSALMHSPTHRDNILFKQYTHIGVGEIDGGPYGKMFVQHFMAK